MFRFNSREEAVNFISKHSILNKIYDLGYGITGNGSYYINCGDCTPSIILLSFIEFIITCICIFVAEGYDRNFYCIMFIVTLMIIVFNFIMSVFAYKIKCRSYVVYLLYCIITVWCLSVCVASYRNYDLYIEFKTICSEKAGETDDDIISKVYEKYREMKQDHAKKEEKVRVERIIEKLGLNDDIR